MLKTEEIKHPESGRSMVEMLGTLAIMGVLSIGGITGYQYGVTKYKSNETMDELNRRAMMYGLQMENGDLLSGTILRNGEFGDKTTLGYGVEGFVSGDPTYFEIALSNVPREVCRDMVKNYTSPVLIDVNGTEYETPSDEWAACGSEALTPEMLFVYSKDLNNTADTPNPFLRPCKEDSYHDVNTGKCIQDTVCTNANQFFVGSDCYDCPTEANPVANGVFSIQTTGCEKCSDAVVSSYNATGYVCLYCPKPRVACNDVCCAEGQVCRGTGWGVSSCVTPVCKSDVDCTNPSKPLCDTVTGQCFNGCRTNMDCKPDVEFCDLDEMTTGASCTQSPERGKCEPIVTKKVGLYIGSTGVMNWWSAKNFCEALGMNVVDVSNKCSNWGTIKWSSSGNCSEMVIDDESAWYWLKMLRSSCMALCVNPSDGHVSRNYRFVNSRALCE